MVQAWSNPSQIVTPWASWTATLTSATNQTSVCKWRRVGECAEFRGKAQWTGAGGAGALTLTLPTAGVAGWTAANVIDTTKLVGGSATTNAGATFLGPCLWYDAGNGWVIQYCVYASTTTVQFAGAGAMVDGSQFANGDAFNFIFEVPIVGWG